MLSVTNTVEQAVRQIRRVLGDDRDKPLYIETVTGEGYRFIAALSVPDLPEIAPVEHLSRRKLLIAAGVAAPVVCLTGWAGVRLLRGTEPVTRVAINGTRLVAMGANGGVLWTYPFDEPLAEGLPDELAWRLQIVDLNGDGLPEVLLVAAFASAPGHPGEIFCFSSAGKVLWQYKANLEIRFNRSDLNGPCHFTHVVVVPGKPAGTVWAAVAHNLWWPSFVLRFSAAVHRLPRFFSVLRLDHCA
jgi:hypothetical protein